MTLLDTFLKRGWLRFPFDEALARWARHALPHARAAVQDEANAHWLRCGGTWFVGVDALPNDEAGRLAGGPPLAGAAIGFIRRDLGLERPLHRAQISVCYPGYPQPYEAETPAAYQYRLKRDAAHVDGLHARGDARRRFLEEPHAYVLGLPLNHTDAGAAPLVVWDGSHAVMRDAFDAAYKAVPPENWPALDVTDTYQQARRDAFGRCERIALPVRPGEATLLHRHLLHGVAPWPAGIPASEDGRMIAYFRPELATRAEWLTRP